MWLLKQIHLMYRAVIVVVSFLLGLSVAQQYPEPQVSSEVVQSLQTPARSVFTESLNFTQDALSIHLLR